MGYVLYEGYSPDPERKRLLKQVVDIVEDYQGQGLRLTLRQLYYQLVSRDIIANKQTEYKRVGDLISRARLSAMLDWDSIEDRARTPKKPPEFCSLDELVDAAFSSYRLPRLMGQEKYVELWVEKEALAGVLAPIARRYHVTLMVNKGYSSTSAMKEGGDRVREECLKIGTDEAVILYLGDMDPSGEDMVRDIDKRIDDFVNSGINVTYSNGRPFRGGDFVAETYEDMKKRKPDIAVEVRKIALTMEQIEEYEPPPNPVKLTDGRAPKYREKHGDSSWEVDALAPPTLRDIIEEQLDDLIDIEKVDKVKELEESDKKKLRKALDSLKKE